MHVAAAAPKNSLNYSRTRLPKTQAISDRPSSLEAIRADGLAVGTALQHTGAGAVQSEPGHVNTLVAADHEPVIRLLAPISCRGVNLLLLRFVATSTLIDRGRQSAGTRPCTRVSCRLLIVVGSVVPVGTSATFGLQQVVDSKRRLRHLCA